MSFQISKQSGFKRYYDDTIGCTIIQYPDGTVFAIGEKTSTLSSSASVGTIILNIPSVFKSVDIIIADNIFMYSDNIIYSCHTNGYVYWRALNALASGDVISFRYLVIGSWK